MKLALILLLSLNVVYGRSVQGESGPSHNEDRAHRRPNFYSMCRQLLRSRGFSGTPSDCRAHAVDVSREIREVYENKQREVFNVWIRDTAAVYREQEDLNNEGVITLCERQSCFMETFKFWARRRGIPEFCTIKVPDVWEAEMWAAREEIESGGRMGAEMVEAFFCARALNPHLHHRHRSSDHDGQHED